MQNAGQSQRSAAYELWSEALLEVLLPQLPEDQHGAPVLLACDEEAVSAAAEALGLTGADAVQKFGGCVELRYALAATGSVDRVRRDAVQFRGRADGAREIPPFFAVCAVMALAASRMTATNHTSTSNYYERLWEVLGRDPGRRAPYEFDYAPWLFRYLGDWLRSDLGGARGLLVLSDGGPSNIGCAINQCVFRARDQEHLAEFFSDRVRGRAEHLDLLRLVQVSSHHHYLTHRAQEVIADPALHPMARVALHRALERWDGTIPDAHGGRSWPGVLHMSVNRGLRLSVTAPDAPEDLELEDGRGAQAPAALALSELGTLAERGVRYGQQGQRGVFLPAAGDTLLFEVREDTGLQWVKAASGPSVYVLSRDRDLQRTLADYLSVARGGAELPGRWQLFERVPAQRLPAELGAGAASAIRPPVALAGGLRVARGWLVGHPPRVEVGEVEQTLSVIVDGQPAGEVHSGGELALDLLDGDHRVDVGDGLASFLVHMFAVNPAPEPYGQLACSLDARGAHTGARAQAPEPSVCGAALSETYDGRLPLMLRARAVTLITSEGICLRQDAPTAPRWLEAVGLDPRAARWEVQLDDDICWALTSTGAIMVRSQAPERLDRAAATAVLALPERARIRSLDPGEHASAQSAFEALQARAREDL
jgi:hypothetical protein